MELATRRHITARGTAGKATCLGVCNRGRIRVRIEAGIATCKRAAAAILLCLLAPATLGNTPEDRDALRRFLEANIDESSSFHDRYDAEVWLMDMSARLAPFVEDTERRLKLLENVHYFAMQSKLPPELVLAVIDVESRFDRFAVSRAGAQGLMQVMPFWKHEIGRPADNLTDMRTNLSYGCRILEFYLEQEEGRLTTALARYNGSTGSRKYPDKVEAAWRARWKMAPLAWY
jgi:soluble lytic murein transglycosylase-like protein